MKKNIKQEDENIQEVYLYTKNGVQFCTGNLDVAFIRRTEGDVIVESTNITNRKVTKAVINIT